MASKAEDLFSGARGRGRDHGSACTLRKDCRDRVANRVILLDVVPIGGAARARVRLWNKDFVGLPPVEQRLQSAGLFRVEPAGPALDVYSPSQAADRRQEMMVRLLHLGERTPPCAGIAPSGFLGHGVLARL